MRLDVENSFGLVIIGLNCANSLRFTLESTLDYVFSEKWFVDSGSSDRSVEIARESGFSIGFTNSEYPMSAASGRRRGAELCETEWILFLDSDMVLMRPALEEIVRRIADCEADCCGFTGRVRDVYESGSTRIILNRGYTDRHIAQWFGGACVMRRRALLKVGNWNGYVIANEEIELYARLKANIYYMHYIDAHFVDHQTKFICKYEKAKSLINLGKASNRRFGALGMAFRSSVESNSWYSLFQLNPEPFLLTPLTMVAVLMFLLGFSALSGAFLCLVLLWVWQRRGLQYIPVCYSLFFQIFVGWHKYGVLKGQRCSPCPEGK